METFTAKCFDNQDILLGNDNCDDIEENDIDKNLSYINSNEFYKSSTNKCKECTNISRRYKTYSQLPAIYLNQGCKRKSIYQACKNYKNIFPKLIKLKSLFQCFKSNQKINYKMIENDSKLLSASKAITINNNRPLMVLNCKNCNNIFTKNDIYKNSNSNQIFKNDLKSTIIDRCICSKINLEIDISPANINKSSNHLLVNNNNFYNMILLDPRRNINDTEKIFPHVKNFIPFNIALMINNKIRVKHSQEPPLLDILFDSASHQILLESFNDFERMKKPYGIWSSTNKSSNFNTYRSTKSGSYSNKAGSIAKRKPIALTTDAIRAELGFTSGLHAWQLTWKNSHRGTHAVVGVAKESGGGAKMGYTTTGYNPLVGNDIDSWGIDLNTLLICHDKEHSATVKSFSCDKYYLTKSSELDKTSGQYCLKKNNLSRKTSEFFSQIPHIPKMMYKLPNLNSENFYSYKQPECLLKRTNVGALSNKINIPETFIVVFDMIRGTLGLYFDNYYWGHAFSSTQLMSNSTLSTATNALYPIVSAVWGHGEIEMEYINGIENQTLSLKLLCRYTIRKKTDFLFKYHCDPFIFHQNIPINILNYLTIPLNQYM
ncbi:unnamed protein product [Gordionus sp. m RMFG-2023]|uniref:uncharacterized protein LOC135922581 n=1 Tax=Gordionus sp. m RMFG-2023 TaxID=3053472 RepID=UPI0030DDF522